MSSFIIQELLPVLLLFYLLAPILTAAASTSISSSTSSSMVLAKPGCRDRCGDVTIPYPFGIGAGCYFDKTFEIKCNKSYHPPRAFLKDSDDDSGDIQVLELKLDDHYARTNNGYGGNKCYDNVTGQVTNITGIEMTLTITTGLLRTHGPFTFSNTRNKFIAVGCDIFAYNPSSYNPFSDDIYDDENYRIGCASFCSSKTNIGQRISNLSTCLGGNGCCEAIVPKKLKTFIVMMTSLNTEDRSWARYPCSYAFLVEEEFSRSDRFLSNYEKWWEEELPLIVDWAIGSKTCKEAQINPSSTYACGENAECFESDNGPGYRCNCTLGYRGNPYLLDGCQDIDECKEYSNTNLCEKKEYCFNTKGSYHCVCPPDHIGDGRKLGSGCRHGKQRLSTGQIGSIGMAIGMAVILLIVIGIWLYNRLEKKQRYFRKNGGMLLKGNISSNNGKVEKAKIFFIEELKRATDNFNQSRIIGKGGFGTIYKGMLSDGRIVAVKKSKLVDGNQVDQFINEVVIISQINHRHIVKFIGCCLETQVPLLVYEFVSNGTLAYHLHGEGGHESSISWKDRLRIATEVAGALTYLHSEASMPILHRDIKSNNILLDENFRAKVSDFGISRSIPLDGTHLTTVVQGTFGYLDPEYYHSGQFTEKSDVYSFGVVLVELLSGERAISLVRSEEQKSLALHFISSMRDNRLLEILDARVINEGNNDEVLVVAQLAQSCLKFNGKERPTMKEVEASLEGLRNFQEHPWGTPKNIQEEEEDYLIGEEISSRCTSSIFEDQGFESSNSIVSIA